MSNKKLTTKDVEYELNVRFFYMRARLAGFEETYEFNNQHYLYTEAFIQEMKKEALKALKIKIRTSMNDLDKIDLLEFFENDAELEKEDRL